MGSRGVLSLKSLAAVPLLGAATVYAATDAQDGGKKVKVKEVNKECNSTSD